MTTIAYKDGIIAYDSRMTGNGTILTDDRNKMITRGCTHFFLTGVSSDYSDFMDAWFGAKVSRMLDCAAMVYTPASDEFYLSSMAKGDDYLWKTQMYFDEPAAIGSGEHHALTAMDLGCSAVEAVGYAIKRDTCSGGRIRNYDIKAD